MANPQRRLPALDGLRGIAILTVVVAHYVGNTVPNGAPLSSWWLVRQATHYAWSGVDLFFVLSGFLIGGIVLDNRRAPNFLRVFYARRALRILPLYWAILGAFAASSLLIAPRMAPGAREWLHAHAHGALTYLTFGQNIETGLFSPHLLDPAWVGVTWSLAVEEHFYFVVPLALVFLPKRAIPWCVSGVVLATPAIRAFVFKHSGPTAVYILTPCRVDSLLIGVLCAWALRREGFEVALRRSRGLLYAVVAVMGAVLLGSQAAILLNGGLYPLFAIGGYSIVAIFYAALLFLAVTEERGPVASLLGSPVLQRMGLLAYGLYLFHQPVLGLAHGLALHAAPRLSTWPEALTTAIAFACAFALAELSWRRLERPLIERGQSFRYEHATCSPAAEARRAA